MADADRAGDYAAVADVWDRLGFRLLESGDRSAAERALTEAFRLRRMNGDRGLEISLRTLAMLKLANGDPRSAHALLDRAAGTIESGRTRVPPWSVYYYRALAKRGLGDLEGAIADFQRTFELTRRLRTDLLPADQVQSYVDVQFRRFYNDYVGTGMQLHARRPSPRLAAQMFIASEENRASGLRQSIAWRERLPQRYWQLVAELRAMAIANHARPPAPPTSRVTEVEAELTRIESAAGLSSAATSGEKKSPQSALLLFQASLRPGEALLSFHLGDSESYVWALTRQGLETHRIASRTELTERVRSFRQRLQNGGTGDSGGLYDALFGQLSERVRRCSDWILVLDDTLFELPLAALATGQQFLVERHSVRLLPSAFMLRERTALAERRNGFVSYGDPIYNRADSRRSHSGAGSTKLELPRIPASGTEARQCAEQWKVGPVKVLTGSDATRTRLEAALLRRPAALHMAVHVIGSGDGGRALVGLGLDAAGQPDFLDSLEISRKRYGVRMVVLSGCSSGRGQVLPGAGLTGLTRAWLLGGAQTVTASHWPTADDTGALFTAFYRAIGRSDAPLSARLAARALRTSQLEMLNSGSWRAEPRYWAAFFVTGRD